MLDIGVVDFGDDDDVVVVVVVVVVVKWKKQMMKMLGKTDGVFQEKRGV